MDYVATIISNSFLQISKLVSSFLLVTSEGEVVYMVQEGHKSVVVKKRQKSIPFGHAWEWLRSGGRKCCSGRDGEGQTLQGT